MKFLTSLFAAQAFTLAVTHAATVKYNLEDGQGGQQNPVVVSMSDDADVLPGGGFSVSTFTVVNKSGQGWGKAVSPNAVVVGAANDGFAWWTRASLIPTTVATATDHYMTLNIFNAAGIDFSLATFDMRIALNANGIAGGIIGNAHVYWDNGGIITLLDTKEVDDITDGGSGITYRDRSFDLSGITSGTTSADIRVYFSDNSGSTGKYWALDEVSVNGFAVIPEPASTALLALGGAAFLLRRRR